MNISGIGPKVVLAALAAGGLIWCAQAYPPAPHHVIHGVVRDEMGEPILLSSAHVFLETIDGVAIATQVVPNVRPGENYQLTVPMDSFTAPLPYKRTALSATVPFRLLVRIGQLTYLPVEMAGDFVSLGNPAGETLINLTLGLDSDIDGLPDAWEYALIQMLGGGLSLAEISPNGDDDGDGIKNRDEYVAGTYAFDPADGLKLNLVRETTPGAPPVVQFFGVAGRTYSIQATTNLLNWSQVPFRPAGSVNAPILQEYYATASGITEAEVAVPPGAPPALFFRMQVR